MSLSFFFFSSFFFFILSFFFFHSGIFLLFRAEIRQKGAGYFSFSSNEEERQEQMRQLQQLREEVSPFLDGFSLMWQLR